MNQEQLALIGPILTQKVVTTFPQIAVDSGIQFATDPILWVGDGDSGKTHESLPLAFKRSQDETDLRFCLNYIASWDWRLLHLFGFIGKRKDHEWANLGEVCQELSQRKNPSSAIFYDQKQNPKVFMYPPGSHSFKVQGQFSILSFEKCTMSISGECEFQMINESLGMLSGRGISNFGNGQINLKCDRSFMIYVVSKDEC